MIISATPLPLVGSLKSINMMIFFQNIFTRLPANGVNGFI